MEEKISEREPVLYLSYKGEENIGGNTNKCTHVEVQTF